MTTQPSLSLHQIVLNIYIYIYSTIKVKAIKVNQAFMGESLLISLPSNIVVTVSFLNLSHLIKKC